MVLLLPLLLACIQTADLYDTGAAGGDGGSTDDCSARVTDTWPADGATDVWLQPELVVHLDPPDPSARLSLVDDGGSEIALDATVSGDGAVWQASVDGMLQEATAYTLKIDTCTDLTNVDFTTLDAPGFPPELVDQGVAYSLDLSYGRYRGPGDLDKLLNPLLAPHEWLVGMALTGTTDSGTLALTGASGNAQTQDTCVPTMGLPEIPLSGSPYVTIGPRALTLAFDGGVYDGADVTLYDFELRGTFAHEGGELSGVEVQGTLDARELIPFGELGDSLEEICENLYRRDVPCQDCGDGTEACVAFRWDSLTVPIVDRLEVQSINTANCHPDCPESYSNPACNTAAWD